MQIVGSRRLCLLPLIAWLSLAGLLRSDDSVVVGVEPAAAVQSESEDPSDPIAGREHWAFRPLLRPAVPVVEDASWPRTDLDYFVLAELERAGLPVAEDAAAEDLLRRVCLLLTGLPATAEQRARYLANPVPQELEVLVDELLHSPAFGERWGRHWLDLARYADSNGLDENFLFREAWRYRNWVIDAINADLPYDRFLLEQLAGDLLPYETLEQRDRQRIAAGFLVVGPKVLLGVNPDRQRMDVADEQLDTIGRAVLGQTIGCARCHDHKFDAIPTRDYYALVGIFTSTRVMEQRYMLSEQRVMERLQGLGESGDSLDDAYESYWRGRGDLERRLRAAESVLGVLKAGDLAAVAEKLESEPMAFADSARDAVEMSQRVVAQETFVADLRRQFEKPPRIPPRAMIPAEGDQVRDEAIRLAGKFDDLSEVVPRGFLQALCDGPPMQLPRDRSGREEFARWLTAPGSRAAALSARVLVNRIWHHMLGSGLVRTVDNFGRTGELPSHPELLDYLAVELQRGGWSIRSLIRKVAVSRVFALSSRGSAESRERDPENRLLGRFSRRRLDPESLRDGMLWSAGILELGPQESTVDYLGDQATAVGANPVRRRTDFHCRSVYLPMIRNDLPELFEAFDFANPHTATGARPVTTVPVQALYLLNDPQVMEISAAMARRVIRESSAGTIGARVRVLYGLLSSGEPTAEEISAAAEYAVQVEAEQRSGGVAEADAVVEAWSRLCQAVFASSRFQYLE
ncbi:MAG: hypothetical protein RLZZ436_4504 [Planctomycetota bacterium]|jgi:hypothetical protein